MTTGKALHPGLGEQPDPQRDMPSTQEEKGLRVLFLCTHNSARSQIAEAALRHLAGDRIEVFSAGTEVTRVHPLAIKVMAARGIDLGSQHSKHLNEFLDKRIDYVITVCDRAGETCPIFPSAPVRIHWSIPDPAAVGGEDKEREAAFQRAADDLLTRIRHLLTSLHRQQG